ncbi:MAG: hypothetical protein R3332_10320 [Pseudohongiellaceae bacterium]|nr:hypothetical protein [Pseudohongiellaceae bacterium]
MKELPIGALRPEKQYCEVALGNSSAPSGSTKLDPLTSEYPQDSSGDETSYILWGDVCVEARP